MAAINDYVINKGWTCIGTCGCSTNMYKYVNIDKTGYEIRIAVSGNETFQIRHQDITRRSGKGLSQMESGYKDLFNE